MKDYTCSVFEFEKNKTAKMFKCHEPRTMTTRIDKMIRRKKKTGALHARINKTLNFKLPIFNAIILL